MTYEPKSTTPRSRQRKRTEKAAVDLLDREVRLSRIGRESAISRLRRAKQPTVEAKRIIAQAKRRAVAGQARNAHDGIGHADVQELRVRLIRRDGGIWEPQASLLREIDVRLATRGMTPKEFHERAALVWAMPRALPRRTMQAEAPRWAPAAAVANAA